MDIWSVFKILFRRWYVTVPLIAAALAAAVIVPKDVAPSYKAATILTLDGPSQAAQSLPGGVQQSVNVNPLLHNDDGALSPAAFMIMTSQSSATARAAVAKAGYSSAYTISQGTRSAVLSVDVETTSAKLSLDTLKYVTQRLNDDLNSRQRAFLNDPSQRVTITAITPPEISGLVTSSKTKEEAVVGGVGLAVAVIAALLFEAVAIARRRRRSGTAFEPAAAEYVTGYDHGRHVPAEAALNAPNGTPPSHVTPVASPRPVSDASTPPGVPVAFRQGEPVRWEKSRD